jgi:hypothetical protein
MTIRFLQRRRVRPNDDVIHDVAAGAMVRLLEEKTLPKGYPWQAWVRIVLVRAWAQYCKENLTVQTHSASASPIPLKDPSIPVPVVANARLLHDRAEPIVIRRVLGLGPQEGPGRAVWGDAVGLLVREGAIRDPDLASYQSGLPPEEVRRLILRAVVQVRCVFEEIFGGDELYTHEECEAARELAGNVF